MHQPVRKYWKSLSELGTIPSNTSSVNTRVKLVNSLALIGITYYLICSILRAFLDMPITSLEPLIAALFLSLVLLFSYCSHHSLSRLFHYLASCLIITYFGIAHGEKDAAEYLLMTTCIMGLMYFDRRITLGVLFLFNLLCFWIVKYTHAEISVPVESVLNFSAINYTANFVALFSIIYYFKRENRIKADLLNKQKKFLAVEKERSENLLLNILPATVAEELKSMGANAPVHFKMATVLFADFKDFTRISQTLTPVDLVGMLNIYFTAFDDIIEKYNIEKIKTIGDAYLCVGGVPVANKSNPSDAIFAALELQNYVQKRKEWSIKNNNSYFDLRIGIHTGPVIAGVVGRSKFAYDIWGHTVNTAARLEATCEVGKINISEFTYNHIKGKFKVNPRGKIKAKHMGMIDMYYVEDEIIETANLRK